MYLGNVFIGFTYNGKEHLLYKKDNHNYVDLETDKKYYYWDVDISTLVSLSDILNKMFKSKRKVIEYYKLDREQKYELDNLIIGNLIKTNKNYSKENNKLFENVIYNKKRMAIDLIDGKLYNFEISCDNLSKRCNYVTNQRSVREILDYDDKAKVVNKKRVLERKYKKFK